MQRWIPFICAPFTSRIASVDVSVCVCVVYSVHTPTRSPPREDRAECLLTPSSPFTKHCNYLPLALYSKVHRLLGSLLAEMRARCGVFFLSRRSFELLGLPTCQLALLLCNAEQDWCGKMKNGCFFIQGSRTLGSTVSTNRE